MELTLLFFIFVNITTVDDRCAAAGVFGDEGHAVDLIPARDVVRLVYNLAA